MYIDLHCHSIASDGRLTPTRLIAKARQMGFSIIAKTDHDSADLSDELLRAGKKYGVRAIVGIELSSRYKNKSVHVIGLGIDHKNKDIISYTKSSVIARKRRGRLMVKQLKANGWHIKKSEVRRKLIVRPHVALAVLNHPKNKQRLLKEFGKMPDFSEFITRYIVPRKPGFVPKSLYLKPNEAIKLIHNAGGIAIIGHPGSKTKEFSYTKAHLRELIEKFSFDGIEVYSRDHTRSDIDSLKKIAKKYDLLISAGSDYHGNDETYPIGVCNNGKYATEKMCAKLLKLV